MAQIVPARSPALIDSWQVPSTRQLCWLYHPGALTQRERVKGCLFCSFPRVHTPLPLTPPFLTIGSNKELNRKKNENWKGNRLRSQSIEAILEKTMGLVRADIHIPKCPWSRPKLISGSLWIDETCLVQDTLVLGRIWHDATYSGLN